MLTQERERERVERERRRAEKEDEQMDVDAESAEGVQKPARSPSNDEEELPTCEL